MRAMQSFMHSYTINPATKLFAASCMIREICNYSPTSNNYYFILFGIRVLGYYNGITLFAAHHYSRIIKPGMLHFLLSTRTRSLHKPKSLRFACAHAVSIQG